MEKLRNADNEQECIYPWSNSVFTARIKYIFLEIFCQRNVAKSVV